MFKNILMFVKYPSVAGIIIAIWGGSGIMMLYDRQLPIITMIKINILVSLIIGVVGFRVEKNKN